MHSTLKSFVSFIRVLPFIAVVAPAHAFTFTDGFDDGVIDSFWWTASAATGSSLAEQNGRLEMTQGPSSAVPAADLLFNFTITGDFDAQVDFELLNWPADNHERLGLRTNVGTLERISDNRFVSSADGEGYLTDINGVITAVPSTDASGRLRFHRVGSTVTGSFWNGSDWTVVGSSTNLADTIVAFSIWPQDGNGGVKVAFDNFFLEAPDTPAPVPLPATLPMLAAGLAGLWRMRRR